MLNIVSLVPDADERELVLVARAMIAMTFKTLETQPVQLVRRRCVEVR